MKKLLGIGLSLLVVACSTADKPTEQQISTHQKDVEEWFTKRVDDLKGHEGWLSLVGLFWLNEGMNSFGSDESNDVVFPGGKIAPKAGYFMVKGVDVKLIPMAEAGISVDGTPVDKETIVFYPDSSRELKMWQGSTMTHAPLEWYVIRRQEKVGIRLKDFESEGLIKFKGIERYPVDYSWNIPAKFEPAQPGEKVEITNVLGQTYIEDLAGRYVFEIDGKEYRLEATGQGEKLFICFGDATNTKETYGAGRFMYVARPDSSGKVFIDFNKAYNPPCAFTEFATCPLPRKENVLPVSILAGEKNYDLHGKQTSSTL
jgi:uncharacterized protein (DUF1684 family)